MAMIIPEIRTKAATLYDNGEALVCGDQEFTYRDFERKVNALVNLLRATLNEEIQAGPIGNQGL